MLEFLCHFLHWELIFCFKLLLLDQIVRNQFNSLLNFITNNTFSVWLAIWSSSARVAADLSWNNFYAGVYGGIGVLQGIFDGSFT